MKYAIFELLVMAVFLFLSYVQFSNKRFIWAIVNAFISGVAFGFFIAILINEGII